MMSYFGSSWWVVLMGTGMVLVWGLIVWAAIFLVGGPTHRDRDPDTSTSLQILDQRLAQGEIENDEYSRLRHMVIDDRSPVGSGGGR